MVSKKRQGVVLWQTVGGLFLAGLIIMGISFVIRAAEEPITLKYWQNEAYRFEVTKPRFVEYQKLHPNIKIEATVTSGPEYWQKLLLGVASNIVPDMFAFWDPKLGQFVDLLEPYPEHLFRHDEMRKEFAGMDAYIFDGKLYYFPVGQMAGLLYYNKDIWKGAGLTENDIPGTWEELRKVAKKLTKYDSYENIEQSGLDEVGWPWVISDWNNQLGGWIFSKDGSRPLVNTPTYIKATQFMSDLIREDHVMEQGFPDFYEGFGTGLAAMTLVWTWFTGSLITEFPDLNYGVALPPTPGGGNLPSRGRSTAEAGLAVFKSVPEDRKKETWKFIEWLYGDEEWLLERCIIEGLLPWKKSIRDRSEVRNDPILKVMLKQAPYLIIGQLADPQVEANNRLMENILMTGMSPEKACEIAQTEIDERIKDVPVYTPWVVERNYKYKEEMEN